MQKIIIIGNAISADIMHAYLKQDSRYQVVAFSVDEAYITENNKFGLPVIALNKLKNDYPEDNCRLIIAIGYSKLSQTRQALFKCVKDMGYTIETFIHQDAKVYNEEGIGEGCIIMPNAVLEVYTQIGKNTVIWANCVVGHHSIVGDNCWIASGTVLAGEVKVGKNSFIGVNVTVSNQVCVGDFNIIGSNTAIHKNTKGNEVYLSQHGVRHRFAASDYADYFLK